MDEKNQIILSFSDLAMIIKEKFGLLLLCGVFCAIFFFVYQLKIPVHYTAEGVFKSANVFSPPNISKALEFFGASEVYAPPDDPKAFLKSYPVMEKVAKALNLQAKIIDPKHTKSRLSALWTTWKAELWHKKVRKRHPDAHVLSARALVLSTPFSNSVKSDIECQEVNYPGEFAKSLSIHFLDNETFEVLENRKKLGKGKLGSAFQSETCSFTIKSTVKKLKSRRFTLSLVPLYAVAKSLEETLIVKKDRENLSVVRVRYTHNNPYLAQKIVNSAMQEFQNFLRDEGKEKITKQLSYLTQRQEEVFQELDAVMEKYKCYLQKHVESGGMVALEKELDFFAMMQTNYHSELRQITSEIEAIQKIHPIYSSLNFEELQALLNEKIHLVPKTLSLQSARALLLDYQRQLDQISFEKSLIETCAWKLSEPNFDSMAYSALLKDPSLQERFENIHALERKFVDERNFTEKERAALREELETEKGFLLKKLSHLLKGSEVEMSLIRDRIFSLQENLLILLLSQHQSYENSLRALNQKAENFPEKWLTEQKMSLKTKIHSDLMESISKIIETKNMGYHLEHLNAHPLTIAHLPQLPDHPKLFFALLVGFIVGNFSAFFVLALREAFLGPRGSYSNLQGLGAHICGTFISPFKKREKNTLKKLAAHVSKKGNRILVLSKRPEILATALVHQLKEEGKKARLADGEIFLHSENERQEKWIAPIKIYQHSLEIEEWLSKADAVIYMIHQERLKALRFLPKETFFVFSQMPKRKMPPFVSLNKVFPLLEKLNKKMLSFSFVKK